QRGEAGRARRDPRRQAERTTQREQQHLHRLGQGAHRFRFALCQAQQLARLVRVQLAAGDERQRRRAERRLEVVLEAGRARADEEDAVAQARAVALAVEQLAERGAREGRRRAAVVEQHLVARRVGAGIAAVPRLERRQRRRAQAHPRRIVAVGPGRYALRGEI